MTNRSIAVVVVIATVIAVVASESIEGVNLRSPAKLSKVKPKVSDVSATLWKQLDHYKPGQRYMCNYSCRKHQLCLVHKNHKDFICTNRHDLRQSRRLFRKLSGARVRPPHNSALHRPATSAHPRRDHVIPARKLPNHARQFMLSELDQNNLKNLIDHNSANIGRHQKAEIDIENTVIQTAAERTRTDRRIVVGKAAPSNGHNDAVCDKGKFDSLRLQLVDWFGVLHKTDASHNKKLKKHKHKCDCTEIVIWMFHKFDVDSNLGLTHRELRLLEKNDHEKCLASFLKSCDHNNDNELSRKEWCCCFSHVKPPCLESKQNAAPNGHALIGAYVPQCDENGYYKELQCHASTGQCWCVNLNGNEMRGTRVRGSLLHCGKLNALK